MGCPAATAGGRTGTATLEPSAGRAAAIKRFATRAFSSAAGATETVALKLSPTARQRLARKRKLRVTAAVTARDSVGNEATSRHAYTLLAPRS